MSEENLQVRTPWFRPYSDVRILLTLLQGMSKAAVKSMASAIDEQTGTPKTLSIGLSLILGLQNVSKAMMPSSLNIFGKTVMTLSIHAISQVLSSSCVAMICLSPI